MSSFASRSEIWGDARRQRLVIAAVGVAMTAPYLVAGPGLFIDDYFALRNAVTSDWWSAAGSDQWRARPGAALIYAVAFGLIGARPTVHAAIAALLLVASALLLHRVLRRFVPSVVSAGVAVAWLLIPNHMSLETWASTLNISAALLLLLIGIDRLTADPDRPSAQWTAAACFGASMLCYEATALAGAGTAVAVAWWLRARGRAHVPMLVRIGVVQAAVTLWMLVNWHPAKEGIDVWMDPASVVDAHVGSSVVGSHAGAAILAGSALVLSVVATYLLARDRRRPTWAEGLIVGGWLLVVLGALPFLRYFYSPVGFGDRVTVVSGLGGAAVLVGILGWVGRRAPRIGVALAGLVLVGALGHRASLTADFATAADDGRRILAAVERRWPTPPDEPVVFGPYPVAKRNIVAVIDGDWPVQWLYGTTDVTAGFTLTREAFRSFPEHVRVDLHELSRLEPVDRISTD